MTTHVAVLHGGVSAEREVSLATGAQVIAALRQAGFEVTPVEVGQDLGAVIAALGAAKPDVRIFQTLIDRHEIEPAETVFVDDNEPNAIAADAMGFVALRFHDADRLREDLMGLGLLEG